MQWYVNLVVVAATGALGWLALELIGRPIRTFYDIRRQVLQQMPILANVSPPKPRETVSTFQEIQEYDAALKNMREGQRILRDLGTQILAFGESEFVARLVIAQLGFDPVAAGRGLIGLSNTFDRYGADRADFRNQIEKALRFKA
jgi:hypothetical protein